MKDTTKVIAALLIGAAAGAALGILLAPEKGETVRDGIADYINDLIEAAKNKAQSTTNNLKEYGANAYNQAKSKISGLANDVSDYEDDVVDNAHSKVDHVKDEAKNNYNGVKTKVKGTANDWNNSIQKS